MNRLWVALVFCFSMLGRSGDVIDLTTYFNRQSGQVFRAEDEQDFQMGFVEGKDESPALTWEGIVSKQPLYVELQGTRIKLISPKRTRVLQMHRARTLPGEPYSAMDFNNARLFVLSGDGNPPDLLCIEAYEKDVHRSTPFKVVYVILDPTGRALLFKIPRRHASSLGIVRIGPHAYAVPEFRNDTSSPANFRIQYYELARQGFQKVGVPVMARYAPGDDFHFELLP